jgi:Tfp pilus assembly protein PilF
MRWKEIWFPLKDIGGLVAASPHAALNVERSGGRLKVGLCPLLPIDDDLIITLAGERIFGRRLKLRPMETLIETIDGVGGEGEVVIALGREKLRWASGDRERNRLSRPMTAPEAFRWTSAEGLYVAGEELLKQRSYDDALAKLLACLEKEPGHVRAHTRAAEIYFRRAEYAKALDHARKALAVDAYDAGANFVYGTINRELGRYADAKDGFGWAARSLEFRSASYEQLAEVSFIEKKPERAAEYARRSLDYNAYNLNARWLQAILFRLGDDKAAAASALDGILTLDPLSHSARFERYLLEPDESSRRDFISLIRNELPHETYLELALSYYRLGLRREAVEVLNMAPFQPMVDLWLAYLDRETEAAKSREHLRAAAAASPYLVFSHRREDIPVLRWAEANGAGWKVTYYLALALWNAGQKEEARDLFKRLADTPDWGTFYLVRARWLENEEGPERALADIRKAIELDKDDWRAWRAETGFFSRLGKYEQALRSAQEIYRRRPDRPALAMDFAKALLRTGRYSECLKVLERTTILPYEGAGEGRELHRQAWLLSAALELRKSNSRAASVAAKKARLWPENLGAGMPFDVDERLEDFIQAAAAQKAGDREKAEALYAAVCAATGKFQSSWDSIKLLGALAFRRTGRKDAADRLMADWRSARGGEDPMFAWAMASYQGDEKRVAEVEAGLRAGAAGSSWDLGTGDRYLFLVREILAADSKK